jgi:hypothetical protein
MTMRRTLLTMAIALGGCDVFEGLPNHSQPRDPDTTQVQIVGEPAPPEQAPIDFGALSKPRLPDGYVPIAPPVEDDPTSPCIAGYEQVLPSQQAICRPYPGYPPVAEGVSPCRFGEPEFVIDYVALCPSAR